MSNPIICIDQFGHFIPPKAQDITVENISMVMKAKEPSMPPRVNRVVLNNQAAIVFWSDDVKTVVKCRECGDGVCQLDRDYEVNEDDKEAVIADLVRRRFCVNHFDEEKAIMAAMLKRLYPNYQDVLRDALDEDE